MSVPPVEAVKVAEFRMYRSAMLPEYVAWEIEPFLAMHAYPVSWAGPVAQMMDASGCGLGYAVALLGSVAKAYAEQPNEPPREVRRLEPPPSAGAGPWSAADVIRLPFTTWSGRV